MGFYIYIFSALVLGDCAASNSSKTNEDLQKRADEIIYKYIIIDGHVDLDFRLMPSHTIRMRRLNDMTVSLCELEVKSDCASYRAESENGSFQTVELYFPLFETLS